MANSPHTSQARRDGWDFQRLLSLMLLVPGRNACEIQLPSVTLQIPASINTFPQTPRFGTWRPQWWWWWWCAMIAYSSESGPRYPLQRKIQWDCTPDWPCIGNLESPLLTCNPQFVSVYLASHYFYLANHPWLKTLGSGSSVQCSML